MYILAFLITIALFMTIFRWNDYREKKLVDVLDGEEIEEILFNEAPFDEGMAFNRSVSDPDSIVEFVNFLKQYNVKKVGTRNFSSKYPNEQFSFQLEYKDERISLPSLLERDTVLAEHNQYIVTNGPIDYKWIEGFKDKQK